MSSRAVLAVAELAALVADQALVSRLREYAPLIQARLAGRTVACSAKRCPEPATRIALPAQPVCEKHANAVVREAEPEPSTVEVVLPVKASPPVKLTEAQRISAGIKDVYGKMQGERSKPHGPQATPARRR